MTQPAPLVVVQCIWCSHREIADGFAPHDAMITHQAEIHGGRALRCGCRYAPGAVGSRGRSLWWTCDEHSPAMIRQVTAWQIANYEARRWAEVVEPAQPSLLEVTP